VVSYPPPPPNERRERLKARAIRLLWSVLVWLLALAALLVLFAALRR
jgi:hypothetical protein